MNGIRKTMCVWWFETRSVIISYRWLVLSCISFMLISMYMEEFVNFAESYDLGIFPGALVFFFTDIVFCNIGMLALIFVMSAFPVTNKLQEGIVLRSGRISWATGQILTIVTLSFLWLVEMLIFVCIVSAGHLEVSGWGQVWGSFTNADAMVGEISGNIIISKKLLLGFEPWQAVAYNMILVSLTGVIYGLLIFCIDGLTKRFIGELVLSIWSLGWIVIGSFEFLADNRYVQMLSPRSWLNLELYIGNEAKFLERVGIILLLILALWIFGTVLVKKRRIVPE